MLLYGFSDHISKGTDDRRERNKGTGGIVDDICSKVCI